MTTCSAACSLATEERPSPGTGSPAPRPRPAPTAHYRTRHQLQALRHPREQDLAQSLCPPPQHTCPLLTRLTSHQAAAQPAACLPQSPCALFRGSLLPCCSWLPCRGSWEHSLALRGRSPISFRQAPMADLAAAVWSVQGKLRSQHVCPPSSVTGWVSQSLLPHPTENPAPGWLSPLAGQQEVDGVGSTHFAALPWDETDGRYHPSRVRS